MFEQKLGKVIRISDPDIVKKLSTIKSIVFEKINGAAVARPGDKIDIVWTKNGTPGFRRPRFLDNRAGETARVWLPMLSKEPGELFRIEISDLVVTPRFTDTRLVLPSLTDDTLKVTFSCTTAQEFAEGKLHAFLTKDRYPLSFRLRAGCGGLVSNSLRHLVEKVKPYHLKDYVFINQNKEDIYFGQNLQPIRGDTA